MNIEGYVQSHTMKSLMIASWSYGFILHNLPSAIHIQSEIEAIIKFTKAVSISTSENLKLEPKPKFECIRKMSREP